MSDKKYNGWTNYETWLCALWMDNDQGSQEYYNEMAQEVYDTAEADNLCTRKERWTIDLADAIKSGFEDDIDERMNGVNSGFITDLLNAAMGEINWYEIAEHFEEDIDEEAGDEVAA